MTPEVQAGREKVVWQEWQSLLHFICCKVNSLIRSNAVQNTMMVHKFSKFTDGSSCMKHCMQGRQTHIYRQSQAFGSLPQITGAFRVCLGPVTYMPFLFDDGVLLCVLHLWLGGLANTQFMLGSTGHMVSSWLMVVHSVSTKAQKQSKSYFSKNCISACKCLTTKSRVVAAFCTQVQSAQCHQLMHQCAILWNGNELWFLGNWCFQGLLRLMKAYLKLELMSISETNLFVSCSHVGI